MMGGADLNLLADDIKQHGLIEPILLYEGKIIDGRNRLEACRLAGKDPRFDDAPVNGSPALFVISKNLHRRHLTTSQRAAIGASLMPMLRKEAKERQQRAGRERHGDHQKQLQAFLPEAKGTRIKGQARDMAGQAVQVGGRTISEAVTVKNRDPEEFNRVLRGETTVGKAYEKVTGREKHPVKITAAKATGIVPKSPTQKAFTSEYWMNRRGNAAKRTMIDVLSRVRGLCRGVAELDVQLIAPMLTKEEKQTWIAISRETSKELRILANRLRVTI